MGIMSREKSVPDPEARKFEIEMFEIELLALKGQKREKAMKSYRRLLRLNDKPIYLTRRDE